MNRPSSQSERRFGRVLATLSLVAATVVAVSTVSGGPARALAACNTNAQSSYTMAASHGKVFYIDTGANPVLDAGYVGYRFTNSTGSTQKSLWASVGNFVGGKLSLADIDDQYFKMPDMTNGSTSTAYFMLKATGGTTTAQTHDVKLWDRRPDLPGATALYQCTYSFTKVQETIKAQSNKVADNSSPTDGVAISASTTSPKLGETLTITVEGSTGQIGSGSAPDNSMVWLTPAAVSSWPTRALRLEAVSIVFDTNGNWSSAGDQVTYANQLFVANAKSAVNTSEYRATYTFRVTGRPTATVKAVPVTQISSGSQVKHSDTTVAGATVDLSFSTFAINASVSKAVTSSSSLTSVDCASGSCSAWGGLDGSSYLLVPYQLTVSTTSASNTVIDELVDTPGSGMIYYQGTISGVTRQATLTDVNNSSVTWSAPSKLASEASMSPQPQHFVGPFTFSSSRTAVLSYWMAVPKVTGTYSNTAYALVGESPIGSSATAMSKVQVNTTGTTDVSVTNTTENFTVVAVTSPATSITTTGAVLNGSVDPNGTATLTGQFEYATNSAFTGSTTVTATTPASGALGGLTDPTLVAYTLTGLSQYTTYYFRVKAGATTGETLSFTTLGTASTPSVTTNAAGPTSANSAVLNGTINPNLTTVNGVQFLYSTSSTLASGVVTVTVTDTADATLPMVLSGMSAQSVLYALDSPTLTSGTTYYYKVRACPNGSASMTNYSCGSGFIDGSIVSFTAGSAPTVSTATLPSSLKNVAYSATLAATGGSGTYTTWTLASGSLPNGLSLAATTGVISGTVANNAASQTFSVTVTDSLKAVSATKSLSIAIISSKVDQTISFASISNKTYSATPFNVNPTSNSLLPVTVVSTSLTVCDAVAADTGYDVYMLKSGTCNLTASQAGNGSYNAATDATQSFTISKANQTVTYDHSDKTFGDNAFTVDATTSANGEGLTPSYTGGTSGVCSINATTGQITILGAGTCSVQADYPGNDRLNSASSGSKNFTVNKKNQNVTFSQSAVTYGASDFDVSASTDATGGGSFSYSSASTDICTVVSGATIHIANAGTCQLTATHSGNSNWNSGSAPASFVVGKKNQTTSFSKTAETYGNADFSVSATTDATGGGGFTYSSTSTDICTVVSGSTIHIVKAGTCALSATHPGNDNWNTATVSTTFAINKKNQTTTFAPSAKTWLDPVFGVSVTSDVTGDGAFSYTSTSTDICTVTSGGNVSIVKAGTCALSATHPGNDNWNSKTVSTTFAINKKNQTIVMSPSSKSISDGTYDLTTVTSTDAAGGGSLSYSGGDGTVCSVAANGLVTFISYGTCNVSASHPGNDNWNLGTQTASFVITNLLSQTITFAQGNKTFGDSDFGLTASTNASGDGSISFTSSTTGVCTVTSGGSVTVKAAGSCTITASHPGNASYNSASKAVTFTVGKKNQVVTFSHGGKTFGDDDFSVSASTDALGDGSFVYTSSTTSVCTVTNGGTVTVKGAGTCTLTAEHPGNGNWNLGSGNASFTIAKKNQTVMFSQGNKVYGDDDFTASATTDATGTGSLGYTSSTTSVCTVTSDGTVTVKAAGTCTLTAEHPGNGNWNLGSTNVTFQVVKKSQAVTFSQGNKTFGDDDFSVTASTDATGAGSFGYTSSTTSVCTVTSGGTVTVKAAGTCTLTAEHPGNGNWNLGSANATFTVAKKNQTVTFSQGNKAFGDPNFGLSATTNATGAGSFGYTSSTTAICTVTSGGTVTVVDVGDCTIEAAHPGNGNWNSGSTSSTFLIGKGTPTMSMTESSKTVGDPSFQIAATINATGATVTYTSTTPSICTVTSGGTVSVVDEGDCTIEANYAGSTQWNSSSTTTTFSVLGAPMVTAAATTTTVAATTTTIAATTTIAPTTTVAATTTTVEATTTTVAATTTTVPALSLAAKSGGNVGVGSVTGVVWVDFNADGVKDKGEPVVPGVEVRLIAAVSKVSAARADGRVVAQSLSTKTDNKGIYVFLAVVEGTYEASPVFPKWAALTTKTKPVTVEPDKEVVVDSATTGSASVSIIAWDTAKDEPVVEAKVTCTWFGLDLKPDSGDEVSFRGVSDTAGMYSMTKVPSGDYVCRGTNPGTGDQSAPIPVKLQAAVTTSVSTAARPVVRIEVSSARLTATGTNSALMAALGIIVLAAGSTLMALGRRRRRSTQA